MGFQYYPKTCAICSVEFVARNIKAKYCDACKVLAQRQWSAKYRATEKGKETRRRADARLKEQGKRKISDHAYNCSVKGKAARQRYRNTEKGKLADERYNELRRLKASAARNEPGARLELAKRLGELTFCKRMRVTAFPLPCGQREECRGCEHCPQGADFGWDATQRDVYTGDWY